MADEKRKAEISNALTRVRAEIERLERTHAEDAKSISGFAELSAHEATRDRPRPEILELSISGLKKSVRDFEDTHPKLVEVVGSLSSLLSNFGV
jgi:hypothetical protein